MEAAAFSDMAEVERRHWWFVARRQLLAEVIAGLGLPPAAELLEIGCGTGGNLGMLSRFGNLHAIEPDDYAAGVARERYAVQVRAGSLPGALPANLPRFDLICLLDVLEHVDDDCGALHAIAALLADGGRVLLTVPAIPWLYGPHDRLLHHRRRYTRAGLADRLRAAGLAPVTLTHFNCLLLPLLVLGRLADRLVGGRVPIGTTVPPEPLNALLRSVFRAERHVLRRGGFPIGASLLAIAGRA